jgi:Holliday junction DNA helicase RuvA
MVLFSQLLSVSGIGPRVALSLLSHFQPGALQRAIIEEDVRSLSGVPGIGTKTAQRIVLELRGKLAPEAAVEGVPGEPAEVDVEVISALTGLGYTLAEARRAAASLSVADRHTPVEDRIRAALQFFARPE